MNPNYLCRRILKLFVKRLLPSSKSELRDEIIRLSKSYSGRIIWAFILELNNYIDFLLQNKIIYSGKASYAVELGLGVVRVEVMFRYRQEATPVIMNFDCSKIGISLVLLK